ncbi:hypothetical protein KC614_02495 [candidate division WWE3 bacterium]|uniref:Uncharacterized protein n=1 Tax=candidate division WWE3 bacterium TaxID=2053526 RepID=A0A955RQV4_UNCKA|nr:hypothetical protein [candidate division WWE3 bacterium]
MPKRILFIHHSTGGNLIKEGHLREEVKSLDPDLEFWDHSYNLAPKLTMLLARHTHLKGLSDAEGNITRTDYNIILSNNSPREYAEIFARDKDDQTLSAILKFDVIAFKNCYPTTRISTKKQLQDDINYFDSIRESAKKYPDKKFVLVTPPPAKELTTNEENSARALELVNYLTSQDYLQDTRNLAVFNFFGLLANKKGYLKPEYERFIPWDSHPNKKANQDIAPIFAKLLVELTK